MLILVTGVPGAGKTSNTLWDFVNQSTTRPRFVTPITGFDPIRFGIGELDSLEHWQDLPDGAMVLVDEAQQYLRPRSSRQVPPWLAGFETHRHRGMDFYLVTQHPGLIDSHVRKLVGRHVHYHRPWGLKAATRYTWEVVQENPHQPSAHNQGESVRVRPNPEVFTLYTSTTLDTHKPSLPWKIISVAIAAVFVILASIAYLGFFSHRVVAKAESQTEKKPAVAVVTQTPTSPASPLGSPEHAFSAADMLPRVKGMPWTAPMYDSINRPTDFPRIAACMVSKRTGCHCYTQQATPLDVEPASCIRMVNQGTFDPWVSGRQQQELGKISEKAAPPALAVAEPQTVIVGSDQAKPLPVYESLYRRQP